MLKSFSFILVILLSFILTLPTQASDRASSTLSAILMAKQDIKIIQNFEGTDINMDGELKAPSESTFQLITNNKDGVIVTFEAISNSANGEKSSMTGSNGTNNGKVILSNTQHNPSSSSIENALSNNPQKSKNPNAIAYKIIFESKNGLNPVFKNNIATTSISGLSDFIIKIDNGSQTAGTFGPNDISGVYDTTIVCTVTTP